MVIAAGLGLGGGLAVLLEFIRPTFSKPDEIETYFEIPVLTTIPKLLNSRTQLLGRLNTVTSVAYSCVIFILMALFGLVSIRSSQTIITAVKQLIGI